MNCHTPLLSTIQGCHSVSVGLVSKAETVFSAIVSHKTPTEASQITAPTT
jgi:hypothetical protein